MPSYRLYLLIKPAPARSAAKRFKDFARAVTAGGGVTHRIQEKATLGLPYPMQAKDRTGIRSLNGTAYTMDYFSSKSCVTEIERNLRMDPDILRFQHSATKRSNHVKLQHLDKSELAEQVRCFFIPRFSLCLSLSKHIPTAVVPYLRTHRIHVCKSTVAFEHYHEGHMFLSDLIILGLLGVKTEAHLRK
jgi:ribosomal protein S6